MGSGLRKKLDNVIRLERKVTEVAKPIYEEWHNALAEVVPEFIEAINRKLSKKGESILGLVTAKYKLKFSDGVEFELIPCYMSKEGQFRNNVFKAVGPEVFTIRKMKDTTNGKEQGSKG